MHGIPCFKLHAKHEIRLSTIITLSRFLDYFITDKSLIKNPDECSRAYSRDSIASISLKSAQIFYAYSADEAVKIIISYYYANSERN